MNLKLEVLIILGNSCYLESTPFSQFSNQRSVTAKYFDLEICSCLYSGGFMNY